MLNSSIAWLDFSDEDRRKVMEVVSLFKERDTGDELGLGSIPDALADLLFPGTSTIQTRTRYSLFVPWLYLGYCLAGNLQAVLDEYLHVLHESLGLVGHDPVEIAGKMGKKLQEAVSIHPQMPQFDELLLGDGEERITLAKRTIRCRYAMRFGDERSEDEERFTREAVQLAFNSPFRPFVLATTSIGQEGLDFHQYCHRVVHWNLPSNPVDLEQREGRVHRYKGHVIRRNLALRYGLRAVDPGQGEMIDPWAQLFARAIRDRPKGANDLEPFWIYEVEGGFKIERQVPMLPLSRELGRIEQLKLSLVAYRSVIGQPRQEEILEFLSARLPVEELQRLVDEFVIDLSPPKLKPR